MYQTRCWQRLPKTHFGDGSTRIVFLCSRLSRRHNHYTFDGGNMRGFHLAALGLILLSPEAIWAGQATFSKDVAPIFQRSCQTCHRPNTFAPMSLITFQDARPWAKAIKEKVVKRTMPPWHIDRNVGISEFANSIALSDDEIATIVNWVDGGAAQGDPADMPPPRKFVDDDKWSIGSPDLVVQWPKDELVPAKAPDYWKNIVVDLGLTEERYIR